VIDNAVDNNNHVDMDDMNERIAALEKDMSSLKIDMAVVRANYTTKTDLAILETNVVKWIVGTATALAGVAFAIAKYIH
jgi:hypothetical protein